METLLARPGIKKQREEERGEGVQISEKREEEEEGEGGRKRDRQVRSTSAQASELLARPSQWASTPTNTKQKDTHTGKRTHGETHT